MSLSAEIFRAYDIRGIVDQTLTEQVVYDLGRALGTVALRGGKCTGIVIGRDGRLSGERLSEQLAAGILTTGCNVVNIGLVPTPVLYYAAEHLQISSAVMLTGSHNPPDYNGLKIILHGVTIHDAAIQDLRRMIENGVFKQGAGQYFSTTITGAYIKEIAQKITIHKSLKVVIDCGNGVPGIVAPELFKRLGCTVTSLYCDVDGNFPNHHPDPSDPYNLEELQQTVIAQQADLGLAFDGDGDRLGIVDNTGKIIWPDRALMLFAQDLLTRKPGATIIYDVKCSRDVATVIQQAGGKPLMWRTGHSLIKAKMRSSGALLAAEMSGHIFFKDRWYGFDDALYTGARLVEILSRIKQTPGYTCAQVFARLPEMLSTPELSIPVTEASKFTIMRDLQSAAKFTRQHAVIHIDGLRVEFADGWGLVRSSNTTPKLVARFEAVDQTALARIKAEFRQALLAVVPGLQLPF